MPFNPVAYIRRIRAVEDKHAAARFALDRLVGSSIIDPSLLPSEVKITDIRLASDHLSGTYLIRLFAEFETALRIFWATARATVPPARTRDLLDGVASNRRIQGPALVNAHAVREYRNSLVHEREVAIPPIPLAEARGHLCKFLGFLPRDW